MRRGAWRLRLEDNDKILAIQNNRPKLSKIKNLLYPANSFER